MGILFGAIAGVFFTVVYVYSIVWAYSDAETRGSSGILVALLVALVQWPIGLILWLVFRPGWR